MKTPRQLLEEALALLPPEPTLAPGHNKDNIAIESVGEGYRLLDSDEVSQWVALKRQAPKVEYFSRILPVNKWYAFGDDKCPIDRAYTFRTRLSRAELAALANPIPVAPKPQAWSEPSDVPGPVCYISKTEGDKWGLIVGANSFGVFTLDCFGGSTPRPLFVTWEQLTQDGRKHSTTRAPGSWKPCQQASAGTEGR